MPRKKANNDGAMLETNTGAVEIDSGFEQTEAVAVAEPTYGDVTTAALADIEADKKTWRSLVFEVADGATAPPEYLLNRLANAVGVPEMMAQKRFSEDVAAVKTKRQAEAALVRYEEKWFAYLETYATLPELQEQLKALIQQERDLRSLINEGQSLERIVGQKKAVIRRIDNSFNRIF